MKIRDQYVEAFKGREGEVFSYNEIANILYDKFGTKKSSILPPDYCYNRINKDSKSYYYFERIENNLYRWLGPGYRYNGKIYAKPRGSKEESGFGYWENGKRFLNYNFDKKGNLIRKAKKVPWTILPKGEHPFEVIKKHFQNLYHNNYVRNFDIERIEEIYNHNPDEVYYGKLEFNGYLVFVFKKKKMAMLGCPIYGNAIYIIKDKWEKISKMSKSDILYNYPNTKRIIHRGQWKKRLSDIFN